MLIPMIKCRNMAESIRFYTEVLDFEAVETPSDFESPSFAVLARNGFELYLSTHQGDGTFGNVVTILVDHLDELVKNFRARGLPPTSKQESPVHQSPLDQSWGTREFYVDDPSGNTLRFTQR